MKKISIIILLGAFFASCGTPKKVEYITTTKPADSCLTNNQYRQYLNFVRDSMRIEAKKEKVVIRFDNHRFNDSLNTIRQLFDRQLKEATKQHEQQTEVDKQEVKEKGKTSRTEAKQEGKTSRTEAEQEGKTSRTEVRQEEKTKRGCKWWLWILIGFVLGKIKIKKIISLLT